MKAIKHSNLICKKHRMPDSYEEIVVIYKNNKPDIVFYAGEMCLFFSKKISNNKLGYFAETEMGELIAVGARGYLGTIKDNKGTKWIQTYYQKGTDNSEMYKFEKDKNYIN